MKKIFFSMMVACFLLTGPVCFAQIYISFEGVEGESSLASFKGSTEIGSLSIGAENATTIGSATGGAGAGKVKFNEFTFTKGRGKSSAALQTALYSGKHYPRVEIRFYSGGDKANHYLTIILETVFVTKWNIEGSGSERPTENFTLVFGKMKTEEPDPSAAGKKIIAGWDQITNKANL